MARQKFDFANVALAGFTFLVHGDRATGKTHLIGDMLRHEQQFGKIKFVNVTGEDGMLTIASFGLGDIGETITEYDDLIQIIEECAKDGYQALGLDSLQMFARLAMRKVTGEDRLPVIPSRDQLKAGMSNEWPEVHRLMENAAIKLRKAAKYVGVIASSDKAVDMLDMSNVGRPTTIAPNLPGKEASECVGWFDLVGYLKLEATRPKVFTRKFSVVPDGGATKVRQRVPKLITSDIVLPQDKGGWLAIKTAVEEACK